MEDEITILKEKLERANRRIHALSEKVQLYEQWIHRAGMLVKSHGLVAKNMLKKLDNLLPKTTKYSLEQIVKDGEAGVMVDSNDPSLQMNWGDEYASPGSGAAQGAV